MKFSLYSVFTKLTLAASVATALVSCEEPEYPEAKPDTTPTTLIGRYVLVNAAPGSGDAQLRSIDNVAVTTGPTGVSYLNQSAYTPITIGQRLLLFSTTNNLNNNLIVARNAFNSGSSYTVFLTDQPTRSASGTDQGGVRTLVVTDNLAAPAAGRAKVRFLNLSPSLTASGANGFGLYVTASTNVSAIGNFLFTPTGRSFRATSYTVPNSSPAQTTNFANFTEVPAGTYTVGIRASATATPEGTPQNLNFEAGKIYTVYARGIRNNSTTPLGISVIQHN